MPIINGAYYDAVALKRDVDMNMLAEVCGWTYKRKEGKANVYVRGSGEHQEAIKIINPSDTKKGFWQFIHKKQGGYSNNLDLVAYSNHGLGIGQANDPYFNEILTYIVERMGLEGNKKKEPRKPVEIPVITERDEKPLPFEPSYDHPYLEFRGITKDTYNSPVFNGLLGTKSNFPHEVEVDGATVTLPEEKLNYRLEDAQFPNTIAIFKNINGEIINKEFVNRFKDDVYEKRKNSKRGKSLKSPSIRRFYEGGIRANSLFRSNIPQGGKATHLFLGEAWMDVMSYYQLHAKEKGFDHLSQSTIFTAHGGQISQGQIRMMNHLIRQHGITNVQLANDYDKKGFIYNLTLLGNLSAKELPFTFEAKGDKTRAGVSVFFIGIEEGYYKQITKELRDANLTGGVDIDATARAFNFLFTLKNYKKVGQVLLKYRTPEITGIQLQSTFPQNFNDWNDQLRGIENPKAGILKEDDVPLLTYLDKIHQVNIVKKPLKLNKLRIEQKFSVTYSPYVDVYESSKNWHVGKFNLDTLNYEGNPQYAFNKNPEVLADVEKIKSFFSPEVLTEAEVRAAMLGGFSVVGSDIILSNGDKESKVGRLVKGRIELNDQVSLTDDAFDKLDIIQANIKSGLPWDTTLKQKNDGIYYNGIKVLTFSADSKFTPTDQAELFAEAVSMQAEVVQQLRPPRYIPSVIENSSVEIRGGKMWYGTHELGLYDTANNKMSLYPAMADVVLPDSFYQDLDKIRRTGYENYRIDLNNPNKFTVDMKSSNLHFDGKLIGGVTPTGSLMILKGELNYDIINTLQKLSVPQENILIGDGTGRTYAFKYTRDVDFDLSHHTKELSLKAESNGVYLGDTQVGVYKQFEESISFFPYIPVSQSLEEAAVRFREHNQHIRSDTQPQVLSSQIESETTTRQNPTITITSTADYLAGVTESITIKLSDYSDVADINATVDAFIKDRGHLKAGSNDIDNDIIISAADGIQLPKGVSSIEEVFKIYQHQNNILTSDSINMNLASNENTVKSPFHDIIEISKDPAFEGRIRIDGEQIMVRGDMPQSGSMFGVMIGLDHTDERYDKGGYFTTNATPGVLATETRLFQTQKELLNHYIKHRDELIANDTISLIAPVGDHWGMAAAQAFLRSPKLIRLFGDPDFCEQVKGKVSNYVSSIEVNPELAITRVPDYKLETNVVRGLLALGEMNIIEKGDSFVFPTMKLNNDSQLYRDGLYSGKGSDLWIGSTISLEPGLSHPTIPSLMVSDQPGKALDFVLGGDVQKGVLCASIPEGKDRLTFDQQKVLKFFIDTYNVQQIKLDTKMNPTSGLMDTLSELGVKVTIDSKEINPVVSQISTGTIKEVTRSEGLGR